jgi:hypothetical protein
LVDLTEIQAAYYMVAATGVLVAAVFYILNLQTQQKNTRINQETRQIQLLLDYEKDLNANLSQMRNYMKMQDIKWGSFDDYQAKYGPKVDPEGHAYRLTLWRRMHIMGLMIRDGLISFDMFLDYMGDAPASVWLLYGGLIKEYRVRFEWPSYLAGFEYLAERVDRYRVEKGLGEKNTSEGIYPREVGA